MTLSSREFNQQTSRAKRAAEEDGPVFITRRGRRSHVLLSIEEYQRLVGRNAKISELLAMPEDVDVDFDPEPLRGPLTREVDFS